MYQHYYCLSKHYTGKPCLPQQTPNCSSGACAPDLLIRQQQLLMRLLMWQCWLQGSVAGSMGGEGVDVHECSHHCQTGGIKLGGEGGETSSTDQNKVLIPYS